MEIVVAAWRRFLAAVPVRSDRPAAADRIAVIAAEKLVGTVVAPRRHGSPHTH